MSDMQLYFAVGVPSLIALVGILVNTSLYVHLNSTLSNRITGLENKMDTRFDLLIGKIGEMDVRLARLEDRMEQLERRR